MKTENSSPVIENTTSKQIWTEPTLINLSVSLETHANTANGGDNSGMGGTSLT